MPESSESRHVEYFARKPPEEVAEFVAKLAASTTLSKDSYIDEVIGESLLTRSAAEQDLFLAATTDSADPEIRLFGFRCLTYSSDDREANWRAKWLSDPDASVSEEGRSSTIDRLDSFDSGGSLPVEIYEKFIELLAMHGKTAGETEPRGG